MPQIGPYTLHAIETGRFGLDGGAMFGIVPKPLWSRRIAPDAQNRIALAMRCLLLKGEDRVLLIDTGIGDTFDGTQQAEHLAIDHETASLDASLADVGVAPSDVTDVILTHLHFDHAGGATRRTGDGPVPTFPNATYHVQASHWDEAVDPNPKESASFVRETFAPIQRSGQLHRVEGPQTLAPGVDVRLVHGHTESQQLVTVSDAARTLVYVADLLPTTHHLAPAWTMAYDVRPLVSIDEKADFLREAHEAEWNLFFEHDPDVAVASLNRTDRGIQATTPRALRDL